MSSNVWVCIPSKRPVPEVEAWAAKWQAMGYLVAVFRDDSDDVPLNVDYISIGKYQGYAKTTNALIRSIMEHDDRADWMVIGGDDVWPDTTKTAQEIAGECMADALMHTIHYDGSLIERSTFACMQPTGDDFGADQDGPWPKGQRYIERIAGSAWIGREFCRRMYGGKGPLWNGWWHYRVDDELMQVAQKMGVFWQRRDLTHYHDHWTRKNPGAGLEACPEFLREINGQKHWIETTAEFSVRKAQGFPGHEPIP